MYVPAHFATTDPAVLHDLVARHAFGQLVTPDLEASHIPFLLDAAPQPDAAQGRLVCHLAAANGQAATLLAAGDAGLDVLCVFQGPHGYISPTWYAKKPAVPTWNYMAVHVRGRARATRDPARLYAIVDRLAQTYEAAEGGWRLADEPESFTAGMLRGIVGIEIVIETLTGKLKLSQNRPPADIAGVIAALRGSGDAGDAALAEAMEQAAPRRG